MNVGLFIKALREGRGTTIGFGLGLLAIGALLAVALAKFQEQMAAKMAAMPYLAQIRNAVLGVDVGTGTGGEIVGSIAWSHPVFLALAWAHALVCCTRVPAGELEKGTIDILLSLPVSRWRVFVSETAAWLAQGTVLIALGYFGSVAGARLVPEELRAEPGRLAVVAVNFWSMYGAVGAFGLLMSSLSDRRGRAVSIALVVLLASMLLNYLGPLWEPAKKLIFLSVLDYYRPLFVLRDGAWPWGNLGALLGAGAVLWVCAGVVFARRDLSTT